MLSHPFPVDRLHYIRDWAGSEEYRQIRLGNYKRAGASGAVDVEVEEPTNPPPKPESEPDRLRRQIEDLQAEIDRMKRQG